MRHKKKGSKVKAKPLPVEVTKEEFRNNLLKLENFQANTGLVSSDETGELLMSICPKVIEDGKLLNLVSGKYYNG